MSILVELPERLYPRDVFAQFSPVAPYNLRTARAMAWMSQLAYETRHPEKIELICSRWELKRPQVIANDSNGESELPQIHTRGVIVTGHGATIIAFAGTDPLIPANWISDFDVGLKVTPGRMHRGFDKAFDSVSVHVTEALAERGAEPLLITGHSMGAALAV